VAVNLILTSRSRRIFFFGLPPLYFGFAPKPALLPCPKVSIASFFLLTGSLLIFDIHFTLNATNGSRRQVCPLAEGMGSFADTQNTNLLLLSSRICTPPVFGADAVTKNELITLLL
jgi:hypothetical protein